MPMLTMFLMGFPVAPFQSPERTLTAEVPHPSEHLVHLATTSTPSTTSEDLAGMRSATCKTARSSETLMCSPLNIASRCSSSPVSRASCINSAIVSSVTRFLE